MNGTPATVLPEWLIWTGALCTILTPIVLFILTILSNGRKQLMLSIESKVTGASTQLMQDLSKVEKEMRESREECREDIRAIMSQLSEYPRRHELRESMEEMRNFVRDLRNDTHRG